MAYALAVAWVIILARLFTKDRTAARHSAGEATCATCPGRRYFITFAGVHCIYGSGDSCWEDYRVLPAFLVIVTVCHSSHMAFALSSSLLCATSSGYSLVHVQTAKYLTAWLNRSFLCVFIQYWV